MKYPPLIGPYLRDWPNYWMKPNGPQEQFLFEKCNVGPDPIHAVLGQSSGTESWLATDSSELTIPPYDSRIFNVLITPGAEPGPRWLEGEAYLLTDELHDDSFSIPIQILVADTVEPGLFDTVATSTAWDGRSGKLAGENVALMISNAGQAGVGPISSGLGDETVNLDFTVDGSECDPLGFDTVFATLYLYDRAPFVLTGAGTSNEWSSSFWMDDIADNWTTRAVSEDPPVHTTTAEYDSYYTGRFVNRDTTIGMNMTYYAPRNNVLNPSFVISKFNVWSMDGSEIQHLDVGTVTDWDIPGTTGSDNISGTSTSGPAGDFVYVQGQDTVDANPCSPSVNRYGADVLLGWHTHSEFVADPCHENVNYYGIFGGHNHELLQPEGQMEPDGDAIYTAIATHPGVAGDLEPEDHTVFQTILHNYTLVVGDTVTLYFALSTVRDGDLDQLRAQIIDAQGWYMTYVRDASCAPVAACCVKETCFMLTEYECYTIGGEWRDDYDCSDDPYPCWDGWVCLCMPPSVGDLDHSGGELGFNYDGADLSLMINGLFIDPAHGWDGMPLEEADIDFSGGRCVESTLAIDGADLSRLIDALFIHPTHTLPTCLNEATY